MCCGVEALGALEGKRKGRGISKNTFASLQPRLEVVPGSAFFFGAKPALVGRPGRKKRHPLLMFQAENQQY
jgi:hypothetical protein